MGVKNLHQFVNMLSGRHCFSGLHPRFASYFSTHQCSFVLLSLLFVLDGKINTLNSINHILNYVSSVCFPHVIVALSMMHVGSVAEMVQTVLVLAEFFLILFQMKK